MTLCTYTTFALNVSKIVVLVHPGGPLEFHVPDVVACFDNDPSMQVYLESARISHICIRSDESLELVLTFPCVPHCRRTDLCYRSSWLDRG
jgi:hypothetical protein